MTHIDLFAGIGGFSLAARWMGWDTIAWCEWDKFCQTVLKYHFPHAQGHGDINKTDFSSYAGRVDLLTGGFPCQPYSTAGKRKGTEDHRNQWPGMLRAIKEISPRWIVGENVRGITNWNGGLVFDQVQADLETAGYEILPFLLPACAVDAPHRRDRIWFIAHANSNRKSIGANNDNTRSGELGAITNSAGIRCYGNEYLRNNETCGEIGASNKKIIANPNEHQRCEGGLCPVERETAERYTGTRDAREIGNWQNFPSEPGLCIGNDGLPNGLDKTTVSKRKWRDESLKAAGNAIVPQMAYQIFKAIEGYELQASI